MSDKQYQIARRDALKAIVAGVTIVVNFKLLAISGDNQKEE